MSVPLAMNSGTYPRLRRSRIGLSYFGILIHPLLPTCPFGGRSFILRLLKQEWILLIAIYGDILEGNGLAVLSLFRSAPSVEVWMCDRKLLPRLTLLSIACTDVCQYPPALAYESLSSSH